MTIELRLVDELDPVLSPRGLLPEVPAVEGSQASSPQYPIDPLEGEKMCCGARQDKECHGFCPSKQPPRTPRQSLDA